MCDFRKFGASPKKMPTVDVKRSRPSKSVFVQPVKPPPERPGRVTNQLYFIRHTVLNALSKHESAGPFKEAVDPEKHYIPNYYQFITYPMDIGTIRKRLNNKFYWSAEECLKDFQYMFMNCYFYNEPDTDLVHRAQNLENLLIATMLRMPDTEVEIEENEESRSVSAMSGFEMRSLNIVDTSNADIFVDDASMSTLGSQRTRRSVRTLVVTRPSFGHPRVISGAHSLSPSSVSSNSSIISAADPENSSDGVTKPKWKKFKKSLVPLLQRQMDALQEQMKLLLEEDDTIENHTTKAKSKVQKKGRKRKDATLSPPGTPKRRKRTTPTKVSSSRAKKVLSAPSNDVDNNNVEILTNGVPKPLSAEELLNLEEALGTISPDELEDVFALIGSYQKRSADSDADGSEVDLRNVDPACLREVQRMIARITTRAPVIFRQSRSPTPVPNLIAAPRLPSPAMQVTPSVVHPISDNLIIDEDDDPMLYQY